MTVKKEKRKNICFYSLFVLISWRIWVVLSNYVPTKDRHILYSLGIADRITAKCRDLIVVDAVALATDAHFGKFFNLKIWQLPSSVPSVPDRYFDKPTEKFYFLRLLLFYTFWGTIWLFRAAFRKQIKYNTQDVTEAFNGPWPITTTFFFTCWPLCVMKTFPFPHSNRKKLKYKTYNKCRVLASRSSLVWASSSFYPFSSFLVIKSQITQQIGSTGTLDSKIIHRLNLRQLIKTN